jgi:RNA polymerase sigma-70 factor (ECF subfamily)
MDNPLADPPPVSLPADPLYLLQQARGGDESALGRLFESYSRYLTLLARVQISRRLRGRVEAADIVQETFLDAHRQFSRFRGATEAELVAWLRRILAGQLSLMLRRALGPRERQGVSPRELEVRLDQSSQAMDRALTLSTPSQHAVRREQAVLLAEALGKLSHEYREVIILRHLESLTFAQVAQRMNRSEDSVQKLWVRALASLRGKLGGVE